MLRKLNPAAITCLVFLIAATQATAAFNNYSMLFDGGDEYINISDDPSLDFGTNNFTVLCWVKTIQTTYGVINAKYVSTKGWVYYVNITDGKQLLFFGDGAAVNGTSDSAFNDGNWHCVGFTIDRSSGEAIFYKDGSSDGILDISSKTGSIDSDSDITIGYSATSFNGNIDEVSIWNKELSSNEVTEIWNNGYPGNLLNHSAETNLVSWWRMGDGASWDETNWTIPDQKGTNTGTSTNMEYADRSTEVPPAPPTGTSFMAR